jgi:hypothetical protein
VTWVGESAKAPIRADDGAALEDTETKTVVVERGYCLRVGEGKNLKAVIEQVPVDGVGSDAPSDRVGAFEHERRSSARKEPAGTGEAGDSGSDDDDVVVFGHVRERTEACLTQGVMNRCVIA